GGDAPAAPREGKPSEGILPRRGWHDASALTRALRKARDRMDGDREPGHNWRVRPPFEGKPGEGPIARPMYGMPNPGEDDPIARPMYGMPNPGEDDPIARPMYGMPNPGEDDPIARPMYGLPMPPEKPDPPCPIQPPDEPIARPMYGLPNPGSEDRPRVQPLSQ
ncbi:MAG: hypothetical protein AB1758_36060, partial [Candidatus Eremiobacterota bacterium]